MKQQFQPLKIAAAVALALALSACGKGGNTPVSSHTESNAGAEVDRKISVDRSKDIAIQENAKKGQKMPMFVMLGDAMSELVPVTGFSTGDFTTAVFQQGWMYDSALAGVPMLLKMAGLADEHGALSDKTKRWSEAEVKRLLGLKNRNPRLGLATDVALQCHAKIAEGDYAQARSCFHSFYTHVMATIATVVARAPTKGPIVSMRTDLYGNNKTGTDNKAFRRWLLGSLHASGFANNLETAVATKLESSQLRDPNAAKLAIVDAIFKLPNAELTAINEDTRVPEDVQFEVPRGAADADMQAIVPDLGVMILHGQNGLVVTRAGMSWYGNGKLSGREYDVTLESAVNVSMSTKTTTTEGKSTKAGASTKTDASVK